MLRGCYRLWALAILTVLAGCTAQPVGTMRRSGATAVERIDFHGWRDCYRLSNGEAEVVFVPQVARIMRYAPAGGENVLWVNPQTTPDAVGNGEPPHVGGWVNYGGYKLWPAPQQRWGWPPPSALDSGQCTLEVEEGALHVRGQVDEHIGIRFDRVIRLAPQGTRVDLQQKMVNVSAEPVTWAVWDVTQIPSACVVFVPLAPGSDYYTQEGLRLSNQWRRVDSVLLLRPEGEPEKVFVKGGPGWLGAKVSGRIFIKMFRLSHISAPAPEAPREVWTGDTGYVELEVVGPQTTLMPGESATLAETWFLCSAGADAETDGQVAAAARACAQKAHR